jgi:hypothetical protein
MIGDCVNVAETVGENINGAFDLNEDEASITGDGDSDATVTGDAVDSEPLDLGSWTGTFVILNCIGTKDCSAFLGTRDFDRALVFLLGIGGDHLRKGLAGNFGKIASNMLYGACLCIAYRCSVSVNGLRIP